MASISRNSPNISPVPSSSPPPALTTSTASTPSPTPPPSPPTQFKGTLTKAQVAEICAKIGRNEKTRAEELKKGSEHEIETVISYEGAGHLREHVIKNVPYTVLTSREDLPPHFASGSYKTVRKVQHVLTEPLSPTSGLPKTPPTFALALAQPSKLTIQRHGKDAETKAEKYAEVETILLNELKNELGVIQIEHQVYYVDKVGKITTGILLHFANDGTPEKWEGLSEKDYRNILRDKDTLSNRLGVCRDMAMGLANCHKKGIINADVKSANCLLETYVTEKGKLRNRAFISDFGSAYQPDSINPKVSKEWRSGSPYYYAPEVFDKKAKQNVSIGKEVDAFALGITMHEILIGPILWSMDLDPTSNNYSKRRDEAIAILNNKIDSAKKIKPFGDIVAGLLDPDPNKRWTVAKAKEELEVVIKKIEEEIAKEEEAVAASDYDSFIVPITDEMRGQAIDLLEDELNQKRLEPPTNEKDEL